MAKSGDMDKRGIEFTDVKLNLEKLMAAKSGAVTALTGGIKVNQSFSLKNSCIINILIVLKLLIIIWNLDIL